MKDWLYFKNCPVCSGTKLALFKKGNFVPEEFGPEAVKITARDYGRLWTLYRCLDCGHIFANPCPSPLTISRFYQQIIDPDYEAEAAGRSQNFRPILNQLDKSFPVKGRLLDVGAATGIFLSLARQRKWVVTGVEPSSWAVQVAAQKYNLNLIQSTFEEAELPAGHFQVITMIDFIEHIPQPMAAVTKASKLLQKEGMLVMVTPNIKSLMARLAGKRWWHYRPAHLAFFTHSSLNTLLTRGGFHPTKISRYTWTFSLYYLLSRFESLRPLWSKPKLALFWKKVRVKLALGDSFIIYATRRS